MSLNQLLEESKNDFIANTPMAIQEKMFRLIQEQQQSGVIFGLQEGSKAKDFTLKNALGENVYLYEELAKGPVVLTFYRGGWCPFCNMQLRAYQNLLPEIQALGGQLIAISPQTPDNTLSQQEKEQLSFHVLVIPMALSLQNTTSYMMYLLTFKRSCKITMILTWPHITEQTAPYSLFLLRS